MASFRLLSSVYKPKLILIMSQLYTSTASFKALTISLIRPFFRFAKALSATISDFGAIPIKSPVPATEAITAVVEVPWLQVSV